MDEKKILSIQEEFFENLNSYILQNIDNTQYTIDNLCEDCLVSRSQLHRKIKEETGLSTTIYIRNVKLEKAEELLSNSSLSISEISYACGFSSPQTLSRYFSASYGISPSQYRNSQNNENILAESSEENDQNNKEKAHQKSDEINLSENITRASSFEHRPEIENDDESDEVLYAVDFDPPILKNRKPLILGILLIPILLIGLYWSYHSHKNNDDSTIENQSTFFANIENSIAVLPFLNLGSPENDNFCSGIQEDILTKLTYFKDLKVISRTSTETYRETDKSIKEIASELGVAFILEGSVRMNGDQVAITAQLIRSSDDYHVWAENYIRKIDDVFKIQNEISLKIAEVLNQKISSKTKSQITNSYQPDKNAYTEYLIGKEMIKDRTHTSLLGSIDRFDMALEIDSNYVDALVFKANAYQLLGNIGYDRNEEYISMSQKFAFEALKLDSDHAQAYAILACHYKDAFQWDQAKITFEIALDRNPNDPLINYWYSLMLREIGEVEKAVLYSSKARELDPLYPVIHGGHIVNLAYAGKKEQAKAAIKEGDVLFNQSFMHHWAKAVFAESIFDHQKAIDAFEKVLTINPELKSAKNAILFNKGRLGHIDDVNSFIENIKTNSGTDLFAKATLYAGLKDSDKSTDYFLKAMNKGVLPSDILVDKNFDFMRHHPRYKEILAKFKLSDYSKEHSKDN